MSHKKQENICPADNYSKGSILIATCAGLIGLAALSGVSFGIMSGFIPVHDHVNVILGPLFTSVFAALGSMLALSAISVIGLGILTKINFAQKKHLPLK